MWWLWSVIMLHLSVYCNFYVDTEFKTPYPFTSSTHLPASVSSSFSGFIITATSTVTPGRRKLWI